MTRAATRTILIADDEADHRILTRDALGECGRGEDLRFVCDGAELLEYLRRDGRYRDAAQAPRPALILLDLNMPRLDGCQALQEFKRDPALSRIPTVLFSSSTDARDLRRLYEAGVDAYVAKPHGFPELVRVLDVITRHWLDAVLPPPLSTTAA